MVALWGFVGVFAVSCVVFVIWYSRQSERQRVADASNRVVQAVATAQNWMTGGEAADGEAIEVELAIALASAPEAQKGDGIALLENVKQRRVRLDGERKATEKLAKAIRLISRKDVTAALPLLNAYVADLHATDAAAASGLIAEAETAASEAQTLDAVVSMSDEAFARVRRTGQFEDEKVQLPALREVRRDTLARVIDRATERRQQIKLAEAEKQEAAKRAEEDHVRQAEDDRVAEEELQRKKRVQLEEALERTTNALDRNRELAQRKLLAPIIGHWRADDGRHLFVDVGRLIVINANSKADAPVAYASVRHVELPPNNDVSGLTAEQNRVLGKLLKQLADVSLMAFGLSAEDHPGADFYVLEGESFQVLDKTLRVTNILAFRKDIASVGGEWVQLVTVEDRVVSGVELIRYAGKEVSP